MATSKKRATRRRPAEPVPTDDPAIRAMLAREQAAWTSALRPALAQWIGSAQRRLAGASQWLRATVQQDPRTDEAMPLMLALLPQLDAPRAIDALWCAGYWLAGDHRYWLAQRRFDRGPLDRDPARARCRDAVVAALDAVLLVARAPGEDALRARALFVLGWLGEAARDRALPLLREACEDPAPVVRATAVVSRAMHGERCESLRQDEDRRVRVCAAIAESWLDADESVIAALEASLSERATPWEELPFNDGALVPWALSRLCAVLREQPERAERAVRTALDGPEAERLVGATLLGLFARFARGDALDGAQRAALTAVIERPALHVEATIALQAVDLIERDTFETVDALIDGVRRRFAIARPPPSFGSRALVSVGDRQRFAQHWMAEFAVAPEPEIAGEIAAQIANTLPLDALFEVALFRSLDVDGTTLSYERVREVAYDVALPEGVIAQDGRLVRAPEGWAEAHRAWCADRAREGWWMLGSLWSGEEVVTRWFDGRGRSLEFHFGHDWNGGSPIRAEVRALVFARHRLTPLVLRAARAKDPSAFDAAITAIVQDRTRAPFAARLTHAAIEVFAGAEDAPPPLLDRAAIMLQQGWSYVCSPIAPYARLLPFARREALAIACAEGNSNALPLLFELAPTDAVLDAMRPAMRDRLRSWPDFVERSTPHWERALGPEAAARLAASFAR